MVPDCNGRRRFAYFSQRRSERSLIHEPDLRVLKQGFRRLTKDLSFTLGRVLQVAEALQYLHNDAIPGAFSPDAFLLRAPLVLFSRARFM